MPRDPLVGRFKAQHIMYFLGYNLTLIYLIATNLHRSRVHPPGAMKVTTFFANNDIFNDLWPLTIAKLSILDES